MKAIKIRTSFWAKPIPLRQFDWIAVSDNYEDNGPVGYGRTEAEAIADLKSQYDMEEGDMEIAS